MSKVIEPTGWKTFLHDYRERHQGQPTRLGVFEMKGGVVNDLWIEDGLPLVDLSTTSQNGQVRVDITLEHYAHAVEDAAMLIHVTGDGPDRGLDILDKNGKTTLIRFEDWPAQCED